MCLIKNFYSNRSGARNSSVLCNRHQHAKRATATENRNSCGTCCRKDKKYISYLISSIDGRSKVELRIVQNPKLLLLCVPFPSLFHIKSYNF